MNRMKRVLILEDEQSWVDDLTEVLESAGYEVAAARTVEQAKELLRYGFYHVLSTDISMAEGDGSNDEGFQWLDDLSQHGINRSLAIIVLTAYGHTQRMREAFRRYNVQDFLGKDDYTDAEFLKAVERAFREESQINLNLNIHWQGQKPDQVLANLEFEGKRVRRDAELHQLLSVELDDLLCRLFYYAKSLIVEPLDAGHGKGAMLKIQASLGEDGIPKPVVVKFGEASLIDREYRNFREHVENFVGGARSTNVKDWRRTQKLGGIVYSFLGVTNERFESFGEFYSRADVGQIKPVIDHLFQQTCARWYSNTGNIGLFNLTADYCNLFNLDFDKLEHNREDLKSVQGRGKLLFEDLTHDRKFTNPIQAAREQEIVKPTYSVATHGDFNENNILVDPTGNTWLIDFGATGTGHILRDVAKLDSVVRFQLLTESQATFAERLELEEALCGMRRFAEIDDLPKRFTSKNPAVAKTFEVSSHLLAQARKLLSRNVNDDIGEYYAALLFNALNTLRFYSLPNLQRQHALLSASLLADRLGLRV